MSLYLPPPPKIKRELAEKLFTENWRYQYGDEPEPKVKLLMVRGYRASSMGGPGNDVNMWDDMLALITPHTFHAINGNLDPSRLGYNSGVGKPYGILQPGYVWWWYPGPHRGKMPAFRQADDISTGKKLGFPHDGKFFVERCWGKGDPRNYHEWGHQQVNIHLGGENTTSSWLCLTVPPIGGKEWLQRGVDALKAYKQKYMPGIIVEGPVN